MKVQMMTLYNIEWQRIRVNLDFSTPSSTASSLATLNQYLLEPCVGYDTYHGKLWRIINLLNATRMGLNGQIKRFALDEDRVRRLNKVSGMVANFRDEVKEEYDAAETKHFKWDEDIEQLAISLTATAALQKVYKSLEKRRKFAKDYKKVEIEKTRPELLYYLKMLEKELANRV